jgi:predicted ATPase/DNA-binding winged helix-turn-helix (wHTH) protein
MERDGARPRHCLAFGPFRLFVVERLLEKDGVVVPVGSRALDVLVALVERAGDVVSKKELMSRAWPDTIVDEGSLRVHVAGLRKSLGDGRDGNRYVVNVPGRGYSFVASVRQMALPSSPVAAAAAHTERAESLPPLTQLIVGRQTTIDELSKQVGERRLVTIHGPGGIGKTTVAIAVAHALVEEFTGGVVFFDLATISDSGQVSGELAATLELPVQTNDATPVLVKYLRDRRMLLILDSCEHVIDDAAILTERIIQQAPQVSILATSREPLQIEGEYVHRLAALDSPPEDAGLTAAEVLAFPAARLFVERAIANDQRFSLTDADARTVAEICRKLDGIALAIELAAGRVTALGLNETAALLDNRLRLLWRGRRTAAPRHQTMSATLDWSYDLISDREKSILRRLSVFVGTFTLDAAQAVAADDSNGAAEVLETIAQLVAKSFVSTKVAGNTVRYRLLDTTRAYVHAKLSDCGEGAEIERRHALYWQSATMQANPRPKANGHSPPRRTFMEDLGNIRAALEWCFAEGGDLEVGIKLAAGTTWLFLAASLLDECRAWSELALSAIDGSSRASCCEMDLQAAFGQSLMFTQGNSERAYAAISRGIELAKKRDDRFNEFRLLSQLHMYKRRTGNVTETLALAQRAQIVAAEISDPVAMNAAQVLMGVSHHLAGSQSQARACLEAWQPAQSLNAGRDHFGFSRDPRIALARTLWLMGYPNEAVRAANEAAQEAGALDDPVTSCIATIWGASVFRWNSDWSSVSEYADRLQALATRFSLDPYLAVADGLRSEVLIHGGEMEGGICLLRNSLEKLRADRYELYIPEFSFTLAYGLAAGGSADAALTTIRDTIAIVRTGGSAFNLPELLRLEGECLAAVADEESAETSLRDAIDLAERQSALSWRLRAETSLARLRVRQGRGGEVRQQLARTIARFGEGVATPDLVLAERFLVDTEAGRGVGRRDG